MALGVYGKTRMGQRGGKKSSPRAGKGPMPAVGGPRPDSTASWPGNPGKENTAPGSGKYPLIKTFVAGSYMPGNPGGKHKVKKVMGEFKRKTLHSSSGQKVTDKDQAMAIAMSEAGMSRKKKH